MEKLEQEENQCYKRSRVYDRKEHKGYQRTI